MTLCGRLEASTPSSGAVTILTAWQLAGLSPLGSKKMSACKPAVSNARLIDSSPVAKGSMGKA